MAEEKEYPLEEFKKIVHSWVTYLKSIMIWVILVGIVSGLYGIYYASKQKPVYTAQLTFTSDIGQPGINAYTGIATQLGLNVGGGESIFEGDNLMELLRSRLLIQKTFLSPVVIDGKSELLVDYYIDSRGMRNQWRTDTVLRKISFSSEPQTPDRNRDSIMKLFYGNIVNGAFAIFRIDRRLNILAAIMQDSDELFAKLFVERLVSNAIQYYTDFKVGKARRNVAILEKQTDSVRNLVTGNIVSIASENDLNINPLRQLPKTGIQKKGIDVQINTELYGELVKNLELSRMALRRETPLIQIIDAPTLPLDKKKMGRMRGAVLFGFIGGSVALLFFILRKFYI
jgi:hypothetical protein